MKNSPLVRTPLQLARTSWQTSAYLTTQMPVQGLTSSASQTLDSKPTEPWVNSNTLRCNTSFEATPMLKLRKRLVSVLFAKIQLLRLNHWRQTTVSDTGRWDTPAPLYRGMPAGKHGPYLTHKDETNGFCLCGLCGCIIGSGRLFVSLTEIRFIFVHYCYKASIKLEY